MVRSAKAHAGDSYAPGKEASDSLGDLTTRYDGIYRVERCWRKPGQDGFLICRSPMVRCDDEPALWIDDDHGDRPRPTPKLNPEHLEGALDVRERPTDGGKAPAWDWNEETERWGWTRAPPASGKAKTTKPKLTHAQKLMREFACDFVTKTKGCGWEGEGAQAHLGGSGVDAVRVRLLEGLPRAALCGHRGRAPDGLRPELSPECREAMPHLQG